MKHYIKNIPIRERDTLDLNRTLIFLVYYFPFSDYSQSGFNDIKDLFKIICGGKYRILWIDTWFESSLKYTIRNSINQKLKQIRSKK